MYNGATFSDNGTPVVEGSGKPGYIDPGDEPRTRSTSSARRRRDPRPFFLMRRPRRPPRRPDHRPRPVRLGGLPIPDGGKLGKWSDAPLPKPPSFDERNVSDKPDWIRTRPHLGHRKRAGLKLGWRCSNASLSTVDDGVARSSGSSASQGDLDNTAIFVTSDNGYLFGEHRVFLNKVYPYEEALRVPLLARMPPSLEPAQGPALDGRSLVNNLDLTATVLDLAGASPCTAEGDCRTLDGRSLVPLLRGHKPSWSTGRALLFQIGRTAPAASSPSAAYATSTTAAHEALRLHRAQPGQPRDRRLRPARV